MAFCRIPFLILFIISCYRSISAIHIETVPQKFNDMLTPELNVTCVADGPAYWAKTVTTIKLGKKGEQPMAIYNCMELTKGPGMGDNMQADGRIEKNARKSFLRVSIKNPGSKDAGTYRCVINYLDESFQMKEDESEANVTVDNQDVQEMVKNLIARVSVLENSMSYQQNVSVFHGVEINRQGDKLDNLAKKENISSAFLAGYKETKLRSVGQTLRFRNVKENIGNDFDGETGIYTAPVDGLYAFNLFLTPLGKDEEDIRVRVVANNETSASVAVKDYYDQSSVSCIVSLKVGQTVMCVVDKMPSDSEDLYDFPYSGFTGHLIQEL